MASIHVSHKKKTDNRLGWFQLPTCILYTYMKHTGVYIRVYSCQAEWNTSEVRSFRPYLQWFSNLTKKKDYKFTFILVSML